LLPEAGTRLVTLLISFGLAAGVSSCTTSTSGPTAGGHTSATPSPISTQPEVSSSSSGSTAASPAASSPSGGATSVSTEPGIFAGSWTGHGRALVVKADGSGAVTYRVYVFCSQNQAPPCDQVKGNVILSGGHLTFHIAQVLTANRMSTASAIVDTSSDPKIRPGSDQRFVLQGDVITWGLLGTFCDAKASANGTCGA